MGLSIGYNSGTTIDGLYTENKISIGLKEREYTTFSGITWYSNAEYLNDSYIIISNTYNQGWSSQSNSQPTFWRSSNDSQESLLSLVNQLPTINGTISFTGVSDALSYLSSESYLVTKDNYRAIVSDGLIANFDFGWYNCYSGNGTNVYNIKTNSGADVNNGTTFLTGTPMSFQFDGTNDYIMSDVVGPTGSSSRTLSVWFKSSGDNSGRSICGYGEFSDQKMFDIYYSNSNTLTIHRYNGAYAGMTVESGVWTNAVFTYDGSVIRSYLNGVFQNSSSVTLNTGSGVDLVIGVGTWSFRPSPTFGFFRGEISKVQLYNRVLSEDEIKQNYTVYANELYVYEALNSFVSTSDENNTVLESSGYTYNNLENLDSR